MSANSSHETFELSVPSGTVPGTQIRYLLTTEAQWWLGVIEAG